MIVKVYRSYKNSQPVIAAAYDLKNRYGAQVTIEIVECIDVCHYPPAVTMNGQLIIWADPVKLRTVVARLMNEEG